MINNAKYQLYATNPSAFRADLRVDVSGDVKRLGTVMDDWQRNDFALLDPGLMRCNGRAANPDAKMRVYFERGRGHSKTTDIAVACTWALIFATRPIKGYCFAGDKDQAGLVLAAVETLIRLNPWVAKILEVQKNVVVNIAKGHPGSGSRMDVFSSDVGSSFGILPDFLVTDELTHMQGDGSLFYSIISSAAKRANCVLWVISNAGIEGDEWIWKVREAARTDEAWIFSRLDGPVASWITPERLEEQRRMLPAIAFARLWLNQWTPGSGDAILPELIDRSFIDGLSPMTGQEDGWLFVAGLDLGLTRDCAGFVVLAVPSGGRGGKIRLAHNKLWRPTLGKKINLLEVERHLLEMDKQFGFEFVAFDPWQAEHLAQTLEADTTRERRNDRRIYGSQPWMREIPPTPANLREQATLVIESFNDRRFQFYDCEPLRRDLKKLRVEEKNYGVRLTSPRDGEGHGDTFSAFALALLVGHEVAGDLPVAAGSFDEVADPLSLWERRKAEYDAEQAMLAKPDTVTDALIDAIKSGNVRFSGYAH